MIKEAIFSEDRKYRYSLSRIWDESKLVVCFVGLNPSTADENIDDPTIRRCMGYAKNWGYGGFVMVNLFAFRATEPLEMMLTEHPIGIMNNIHLKHASKLAAITIMAWGNHGKYMNRSKDVKQFLGNAHYLILTKEGEPGHPLYLKKTLKPIKL